MRMQWIPLIIALIINLAADYYIYIRLAKAFKPRWIKLTHCILSALLLLYIIIAVALPRRTIDNSGLVTIMWMLCSYFTFYVPKYIAIITYWICRIPLLVKKHKSKIPAAIATVAGIFTFVSMWWGLLVTRYDYEIKEVTLEFDNLPESFNGYRIVQFSDLHLGSYAEDTTYVSRLVDAINGLHSDIIFFTGDIVNRQTDEAEPFVPVLRRLHAHDGVFSILGNHDYGDYKEWESAEAKAENNRYMARIQDEMGWNLMNNCDTVITRGNDSITVIGVENWGEPPFSQYGKLSLAHQGLNDDKFKILLSHNPRHWRGEVLTRSNIDLMLSGHTHAMQIEIDLFGLRLSPAAWIYPEWGGIYKEGKQVLYVNIGIGEVAMPMRIGATPEITVITLKNAGTGK